MTNTDIALSLREHKISFILPAGATLKGDLDLPNGGLIAGELIGDVRCQDGSLIIEKKAHFRGRAVADKIYVRGRVSSGATQSQLIGEKLVAISAGAEVTADVYSGSTTIAPSTFNGTVHTLDELNELPPRLATGKPEKLGQSSSVLGNTGARASLPAAQQASAPPAGPRRRPAASPAAGTSTAKKAAAPRDRSRAKAVATDAPAKRQTAPKAAALASTED